MLPPTLFTFVGRRREMSRLADVLAPRIISVPVVAITGPGGVGKSALAIRMAHQQAAAFPDGQLYLNLKGSDPQLEPMWPAEALRLLLVALGVPAAELPADPQDASVLYRARMSGR